MDLSALSNVNYCLKFFEEDFASVSPTKYAQTIVIDLIGK